MKIYNTREDILNGPLRDIFNRLAQLQTVIS